jgi:hypothetical protein
MAKNNKVALSDSLMAFDIVITKGHHIDHHYEYQGLKAWYDFDGYTCYLSYMDLTLTLLFHGRYAVDFQQQETLKAFLSKINKLLTSKL